MASHPGSDWVIVVLSEAQDDPYLGALPGARPPSKSFGQDETKARQIVPWHFGPYRRPFGCRVDRAIADSIPLNITTWKG
jgi:hypothetical protein